MNISEWQNIVSALEVHDMRMIANGVRLVFIKLFKVDLSAPHTARFNKLKNNKYVRKRNKKT